MGPTHPPGVGWVPPTPRGGVGWAVPGREGTHPPQGGVPPAPAGPPRVLKKSLLQGTFALGATPRPRRRRPGC